MMNMYRRGLGNVITWLFFGVTGLYVVYRAGLHLIQVDGGYTEWSDFTSCSATCGGGSSSRTRSCTNPPPNILGRNCSRLGPAIETKACNTQPCPVDGKYGPWGEYGRCSVTCGEGTKTRERKCDSPAPQHGGKDCSGEGEPKETTQCNEKPCPVNGGYDEWSGWTPCSATCGTGKKRRTRTCTKPLAENGGKSCTEQNLGPPVEDVECSVKPCEVPTNPASQTIAPASVNTT